MCVFNRVMADSGTTRFIASQEMAHGQGERGRAAGSATGPLPWGVNKLQDLAGCTLGRLQLTCSAHISSEA